MSWPEEMSFIANSSKMDRHKGKLVDIEFLVFSRLWTPKRAEKMPRVYPGWGFLTLARMGSTSIQRCSVA